MDINELLTKLAEGYHYCETCKVWRPKAELHWLEHLGCFACNECEMDLPEWVSLNYYREAAKQILAERG